MYGLGEVIASSGFRRDVGDVGNGSIQTMWTRDVADPVDENECASFAIYLPPLSNTPCSAPPRYGVHPFYVEHRLGSTNTSGARSHGVFLNSAAGADVLLLSPPGANASLVEYRMLGGTLDLYFFSGPGPMDVVEQYAEVVGTPAWQPLWAFGFHLCRWGYSSVDETRGVVQRMRDADIPLEGAFLGLVRVLA